MPPLHNIWIRGSQTFSGHVPLQHFDRWACTLKIYYDKKAEENKKNIIYVAYNVFLNWYIHWYMYK